MPTRKLFDCQLGTRFRYLPSGTRVYVLLSYYENGQVCDAPRLNVPRTMQGIYAAAETREEFKNLEVEALDDQE